MSEFASEVSDEELLVQIRDGNADALSQLYDRHHRAAFALAFRIVNDTGQAEDVVQEALLAVWRHAASYRPERGRPRTWLMTIIRNRAINQLRGRQHPNQMVELDDTLLDDRQPEVSQVVYEGVRRDEIRTALDQLPDEQRVAIELAFFSGLSHQEIAERLEIPLGTVKSRIRLAFRKLEIFLQAYALEQSSDG